jgi:hypothetical protein
MPARIGAALRRGISLTLSSTLACLLPTLSASHAQDAPHVARRHYDIAALPLDVALNRFSEVSGIDVLLHDLSPASLRTRPLQGDHAATAALAIMLEGTGLVARFTSATSAVILPKAREAEFDRDMAASPKTNGAFLSLDLLQVTAPRLIGLRRNSIDHRLFVQQLAASIRDLIAERAILKGGSASHFRLAARITQAGIVHDVQILSSSHGASINARLTDTLNNKHFDLAVPPGLPQPIIFEVTGR